MVTMSIIYTTIGETTWFQILQVNVGCENESYLNSFESLIKI